MNIKRKLLHCFVILLTILTLNSQLSIFNFSISAQEQKLMLAQSTYKSRQDLDALFAQSVRVLSYFEGEGEEKPVFLSLISESQKQKLLLAGFEPKILDQDANIGNYLLFFHPQPNQSEKLSELGQVFEITPRYSLVKKAKGIEFQEKGELAEFFLIPFSENVVDPPLREKTVKMPTPTTTRSTSQTAVSQSAGIFSPLLAIYLVVGPVVLFLIYYLTKRNNVFRTRKARTVAVVILVIAFVLGFVLVLTIEKARKQSQTRFEDSMDLTVEDVEFF